MVGLVQFHWLRNWFDASLIRQIHLLYQKDLRYRLSLCFFFVFFGLCFVVSGGRLEIFVVCALCVVVSILGFEFAYSCCSLVVALQSYGLNTFSLPFPVVGFASLRLLLLVSHLVVSLFPAPPAPRP